MLQIALDAAVPVKLILLILAGSSLAAVVIAVRKLAGGRHLTGGSAFLSALRLGGPLLGCLGAAYGALVTFIALSHVQASFQQVAPALAEGAFLVVSGLLSGVVAVICHWAVEARIDRTVLGG